MPESSLKPGRSLESDLKLIREARGLSREDVFNRVHIRPEVLAQVEEHGFGATPTLSSEIHRRSFVKHYADAVEIDPEKALHALETSMRGAYDGSLARAYLGEAEPVVDLESSQETGELEIGAEPAEAGDGGDRREAREEDAPAEDLDIDDEGPSAAADSPVPEFDLPRAATRPVFPVPELEPDLEDVAPEEAASTDVVESEPLETETVDDEEKLEAIPPEVAEIAPTSTPVESSVHVEPDDIEAEDEQVAVDASQVPDSEGAAGETEPHDEPSAEEEPVGHDEVATEEESSATPTETVETEVSERLEPAEMATEVPDEPAAEVLAEEQEADAELGEAPKPGVPIDAEEPEEASTREVDEAVVDEVLAHAEVESDQAESAVEDVEQVSQEEAADESDDDQGEPISPWAPPIPGRRRKAVSKQKAAAPESASEGSPRETIKPPIRTGAPAVEKPTAKARPPLLRDREAAEIPASTLKQSHIEPLGEGDMGDEAGVQVRFRRHWVAWTGLVGVAVVVLFFIGQAIFGSRTAPPPPRPVIGAVDELPRQFSGIVRLTPTSERFVTLQIHPDSQSTFSFDYKIWTHSAGSTFAETGVGSLDVDANQLLLGEPYGVGGLFILEDGQVRLRSVRRVRFPRWEFTGRNQGQ